MYVDDMLIITVQNFKPQLEVHNTLIILSRFGQ